MCCSGNQFNFNVYLQLIFCHDPTGVKSCKKISSWYDFASGFVMWKCT